MRSEEYRSRIGSSEWRALRRRLILQAGGRCQRCGHHYDVLQLHHKTYDRLGYESDDDLQVLCINCHRHADRERAEEAQYGARFRGWARKVYGEDWEDRVDIDIAEERFERWLDQREIRQRY